MDLDETLRQPHAKMPVFPQYARVRWPPEECEMGLHRDRWGPAWRPWQRLAIIGGRNLARGNAWAHNVCRVEAQRRIDMEKAR